MRIAITGARGYVGRFVAETLSNHFDVIGLARNANQVTEELTNVDWRFGDLQEVDYLASSFKDADLVIHCAMSYTQEGNEDDVLDKKIIDTVLAENKTIIYTSSLFGVKDGRLQSEETQPGEDYWRFQQEKRVLEAGGNVVRLGFVYGGNAGYFWEIVKPDSENKVYVTGEPDSVWPMINVFDLADLYLKIALRGTNQIYHAWDGFETRYFKMFETISLITGCEIIDQNRGYASKFMQATNRVTNKNSLNLGWKPLQGDLLSNLNGLIPEECKSEL